MSRAYCTVTIAVTVDDEAALRQAAHDRALADGLEPEQACEYLDAERQSIGECCIMLFDPGISPPAMRFTSQDRRYHAAYELLDDETKRWVDDACLAVRKRMERLQGCKPRNDDAAEAFVAAMTRYAIDSGVAISYPCRLAIEGLAP